MKNVMMILEEFGIEVPEDKKKDLDTAVVEHYKPINAYNDQVSKLEAEKARTEELNAQVTELSTKMKDLEGSDGDKVKMEELNSKIKAFEEAETARKEADSKAKKDKALSDGFDAAIKEKGQLIPFVREGLLAEAKKLMEEDQLLGIDKAVEKIIKGKNGIFINSQITPPNQPVPGNESTPKNLTFDQLKSMSTEEVRKLDRDVVDKLLQSQKREK